MAVESDKLTSKMHLVILFSIYIFPKYFEILNKCHTLDISKILRL